MGFLFCKKLTKIFGHERREKARKRKDMNVGAGCTLPLRRFFNHEIPRNRTKRRGVIAGETLRGCPFFVTYLVWYCGVVTLSYNNSCGFGALL